MKNIPRKVLALSIVALLACGINAPVYAEDGVEHEPVETTDTETPEVEEVARGVGEHTIVDALSEAMVDRDDTGETDFDTASAEVMELRDSGLGWGQVARELDFNLGHVMGDYHSNRPDSVTERLVEKRAARVDGIERSGRPERPERFERAERPERPERPEHPQKPDRPGRG